MNLARPRRRVIDYDNPSDRPTTQDYFDAHFAALADTTREIIDADVALDERVTMCDKPAAAHDRDELTVTADNNRERLAPDQTERVVPPSADEASSIAR